MKRAARREILTKAALATPDTSDIRDGRSFPTLINENSTFHFHTAAAELHKTHKPILRRRGHKSAQPCGVRPERQFLEIIAHHTKEERSD
jgi:hypothetical protein